MAKGDEKKANEKRDALYADLEQERQQHRSGPTQLEQEMGPITQGYQNRYENVANQQVQHYNDITGLTREWRDKSITPTVAAINARQPSAFTTQNVNYERNPETTGSAITGYQDFANTGGYSGQDIQELRARGISPIRSTYQNAMMQMDRGKALQGGYAPNYMAAQAQMQRELPQQLSDATTNVNAGLADAIRQGKLSGLSGLSGIGSMESGHRMSAALANQSANLRAQEGTEQALSAHDNRKLDAQRLLGSSIDMERSLYGTSPGASAAFGNQAQQAYQQRLALDELRNQRSGSLADLQIRTQQPIDTGGTPWWEKALKVAAVAAPYVAMAASTGENKTDYSPIYQGGLNSISSSKDTKEGVTPITDKEVDKGLRELPLFKWRYKGEKTKHMGPIAEDFKKIFGVGDGKTLHLADVMGVTLASARYNASNSRKRK